MLDVNHIYKNNFNPYDIKVDSGLLKMFNEGIKELKSTISNSQGSQIIFDERGYKKYLTRKNTRTEILNNRLNLRGRNV